jgi:oligosaccharide repeat unit polymerase
MISNPCYLFGIVWGSVLVLYNLKLSNILLPLNSSTYYLIIFSGILLALGYAASRLLLSRNYKDINHNLYKEIILSNKTSKKFRQITYIFAILSIIEIIYFKNIPLLYKFGIGIPMTYDQFGILSIHGIINAIYFNIILFHSIKFYYTRKIGNLTAIFLLFLWPVMLLNRMLITSTFLQIFFAIFILSSPNRKYKAQKYIYGFIMFFILILVFGIIGDLRSGSIGELGEFNYDNSDFIPSGFEWLYLYVTTPINNINYSIDNFTDINYIPTNLLASFLPSFIRNSFYQDVFIEIDLVHPSFTVSTLFAPFLGDFGYLLTPLAFFPIGLIASLAIVKAYNNPKYFLFWIAFLYSIVVSIFANQMISLVFIFEGILWFMLINSSYSQYRYYKNK